MRPTLIVTAVLTFVTTPVLAQSAPPAPSPAPSPAPPSVTAPAPNAPAPSAPAPTPTPKSDNFFERLGQTAVEDMTTPVYTAPDPNAPAGTRRREAAPFDGPPFPVGEWQMNGTSTIGDPNEGCAYPSLIMDTLYNGPNGQWWKDSRLAMYGWIELGGNISNSRDSNAPTGYAIRPNKIELDQVTLYFERRPDEAQTDHFDWGFRIANLYGLDYRFMITKGILDEQLHTYQRHATAQRPSGQLMGYDMPMCYTDLYFPWIAEGMNVRVGRFISIPDIEAQLAPDNLMYTHSLLYTYDIFTMCGAVATIKLSDMWAIQLGVSAGSDVAPWEHRRFTVPNSGPSSPRREVNSEVTPTGIAMVQWIGPKWALGQDSVYFGVNGINDGRYGYNNIQELPIVTWTHKFNDTVYTAVEGWYMFERNDPTLGYAWEAAVVNYTEFRLAPGTFLSVRNEYFNDGKGQRTGVQTQYSEHSVGITHWFNKLVCFRPEVGYWHSYDARAFDDGRKASQYLLAADLIIHY